MRRFSLSIIIIVIFASLAFAQGGYSPKDVSDDLHNNYSTTTAYRAWVAANTVSASVLTSYRLVIDSYSTSEVNTLLNAKLDTVTAASTYATIVNLALKANSADVYTTSAVDLLLSAKLDASALIPYYTAVQIDIKLTDYATTGAVALKADSTNVYTKTEADALLSDKASTGSVALKASQTQVDSEAVGLNNHIGDLAGHGHSSPVGQPSNRLEVTDGAGGWMFTSVAAAGGGVTNAVDLNSNVSTFTRILNGLASNAQTAFEQIDQNAATTAEVAAKANTADVYTKAETNSTIEDAIAAIPPPDLSGYYTKAEINATIEDAIAAIPTSTFYSGSSTFNTNTGVTVSIGTTLSGSTYEVFVTPTAATGGTVGDIYITDKGTTTFKVKCVGSNTTATFDWILKP